MPALTPSHPRLLIVLCGPRQYGALLVAVEMGGEPLHSFEHPERAVYLLGSEDNGLPDAVVRACHRHVTLPAVRTESFNVAAAGSILMYDRQAKAMRARDESQIGGTEDSVP